MLTVLRDPTYARLFSAQVIALLGTGLLTVALGLLAFDIAGDAAGSVLGTALTIKMLAYVGVAPVAAALLDRAPVKAVLVGADVLRLGVALVLPWVDQTWHVYVLVFVLQAASATFTPTFQSVIPTVLPDERDYTRALALSRSAYDLEAIISPVLAAALLLVMAYGNLFVGTAAGFALSAVLVLAVRLPGGPARERDGGFFQRLPVGVRVFTRTPSLRFLMLTNLTVAAATALVLVNTVVYTRSVLGLDESALALTLACYGAGSLVVAVSIPALVDRFGVVPTMTRGLLATTTVMLAALGVTATITTGGSGWPWLLAVWVLLGAGTAMIATPSARLLVAASTAQDRGLVYTAQFALSHACFLLTYPIAGWLGAIDLTLAAAALLTIAVASTVAGIRHPARRAALRQGRARPRERAWTGRRRRLRVRGRARRRRPP